MNIPVDVFISFLVSGGVSVLDIYRSCNVSIGGHTYNLFLCLLVFRILEIVISNYMEDGGGDE